jgi:hypothetical protein
VIQARSKTRLIRTHHRQTVLPYIVLALIAVIGKLTAKQNRLILTRVSQEPIGNIPPVEFEAAYYEQENGQAMAA